VCFDTEGAQLWEMVFYDEDSSQLPNGIAVRDDLVAITRLWHTGSDVVDHVALYRLTDRTTAPTMVWETAMEGNGTGLWPHGPTITDGEVIITLAALGKIVGFDLETGEETWRIPGERSNAQLAFPRGAVPLPDGSFVVSDAGAELLRVWDAFGSFEVVDAVRVPGVFSVDVLDCADAACK
jgi:outer membrane protein assembly factor BamB